MIKINKKLTEKHKRSYKRYRIRSERKDATLLVARGLIWASATILLLGTIFKISAFVFILFVFTILLLKNIYIIYYKRSKKYQLGNSYVKRKWKIVGGFINIYCVFATCIMYSIGLKNIVAGMTLDLILFSFLLITHRWFVNKLWYEIDKKFYLEIDKKNPYQKKYLLEPKFYWSGINNNGDDEPQ